MEGDDLELDKIGDRKTALFCIVSDTDMTFNFTSAMVYTQMFNVLCDKALENGGALKTHVTCLLDEFANQKIPNFQHLISVIRSREISAHIVVQTQSQLKAVYKDQAETIIGNCSCVLFLGGKERSTFVDHHKYVSNKRTYYGIRNMSDKLCRDNGLSVVVPGKGSKGKNYAEYQAEKTGTSWKGKLKIAVDALIPQVSSFEELLQRLQAAGYEITPGKYISCRAPGQERFTRLKTLGMDYTEEAIRERIAGKRTRAAKAPKAERKGVNLLIDIENSIKAQQSRGYEQWAKIHNLKQAAKTMNFLTENKIEQYTDLLTRIEEITTASEQAGDSLKELEKRLSDMALLIKNVTTYQKTKPLYEAYRKARNKEKYRAEHERGIILHEAAAKALKAAQIGGKLPSVPVLQAEYEKLQAQKESLYADYGKLKKQVQEYDVIKRNIDSILQTEKQPERERQTERG